MRDPMLDGAISSLVAYRNAGEGAREEAGELEEADGIVAGLVEWCRVLLRDTDIIVDWEEGRELSGLLALPASQLPLLAFDNITDVNRRSVLRSQFERFLENGEQRDTNVMAWLLGEALAKALVECLEHSNEVRVSRKRGEHPTPSS